MYQQGRLSWHVSTIPFVTHNMMQMALCARGYPILGEECNEIADCLLLHGGDVYWKLIRRSGEKPDKDVGMDLLVGTHKGFHF